MQGLLKWFLLIVFFLCQIFEPVKAQDDHYILFYNLENLYDTFDNPNSNDGAFTPQGENHWTIKRFSKKILLIYKAIIAGCKGQFPDIIGLAEIENNWVAEQLISCTPFCKFPYGVIHKESPDPRGIDVALLYRKDKVIPVDYEHIEVSNSSKPVFASRDILHFTGEISGNRLHFFINHWPSRSGGYNETKANRNIAAKILRARIDSLLFLESDARILILGDFNSTPKEECMVDILKAHPYPDMKESGSLFNLSTAWQKSNWGTIKRNGQWDIFDQIICSSNLLENSLLHIVPSKTEICRQSFLLEPDKTYLGRKPYRTYLGPAYHGGVSDHLPIVTVLSSGK
jgi:predicted extracellular nuclease